MHRWPWTCSSLSRINRTFAASSDVQFGCAWTQPTRPIHQSRPRSVFCQRSKCSISRWVRTRLLTLLYCIEYCFKVLWPFSSTDLTSKTRAWSDFDMVWTVIPLLSSSVSTRENSTDWICSGLDELLSLSPMVFWRRPSLFLLLRTSTTSEYKMFCSNPPAFQSTTVQQRARWNEILITQGWALLLLSSCLSLIDEVNLRYVT